MGKMLVLDALTLCVESYFRCFRYYCLYIMLENKKARFLSVAIGDVWGMSIMKGAQGRAGAVQVGPL